MKNSYSAIGLLSILGLFLILAWAGCSDDDPTSPPLAATPGQVELIRAFWYQASLTADPMAGGNLQRTFAAEDRVETLRWYTPRDRVPARYLDPQLSGEAADETVAVMEMYLRTIAPAWEDSCWGGIMCSPVWGNDGFPDISGRSWLDIWVNDGVVDPAQRSGKLHVDFGRLDEDFFWGEDENGLMITGMFDQEDGAVAGTEPDGVWTYDEDIGLDANEYGPELYLAEYEIKGDAPYPHINGTARNNREDTEDVDRNGHFDQVNSYFTHVIDLAATTPLVDVVQDFEEVDELFAVGAAWRLYRIPLRRDLAEVSVSGPPDLRDIRHFRIWYEDPDPAPDQERIFQFAGIRFH